MNNVERRNESHVTRSAKRRAINAASLNRWTTETSGDEVFGYCAEGILHIKKYMTSNLSTKYVRV